MSGTISGTGGGFPGLAAVIQGAAQTKQRLDTLTQQVSTGLVSTSYAGLGAPEAGVSLSLAPQVADLQVAQKNIDRATGPVQVAQTAMTQIQSIASDMLAQMPNLNGLDPVQVDTVAASARSDLSQLAGLLDTQYGGVYVFSGQDTANPPVPGPDQIASSGFYTQISAAVGALSTNGAAATAASTLAIASSNAPGTSPFSTYLSQPAASLALPAVGTGNGQTQTIGLLASANTSAVSTGGSTTGSYMRDLMRALATIGSLSSSQVNDPNFAGLVADTQTSLQGAVTAMSTDVGVLGEQQSNLTALQTNMSDTQTALTKQLSNAQDVDMTTALSNLSLTQTQLQASYQLISMSSAMSLVKFLPAG